MFDALFSVFQCADLSKAIGNLKSQLLSSVERVLVSNGPPLVVTSEAINASYTKVDSLKEFSLAQSPGRPSVTFTNPATLPFVGKPVMVEVGLTYFVF